MRFNLQLCVNIKQELLKQQIMTLKKVRELEKGLSPFLPKGAVKAIAKMFGRDYSTISLILKGKWEDDAVINAAIVLMENDIAAKQAVVNQFRQS